MLAQLTIANFAIVHALTIDFQSEISMITRETDTGTSIAIDALGLYLGSPYETNMVRPNAASSDICGAFYLTIPFWPPAGWRIMRWITAINILCAA